MGWCGISSESLGREHNRVAAGTPYDNHGAGAGRRRSPGPSTRVRVGEIRTLERAFNTMAGSLGDARAEWA
jgi:hypothetical protein